MRRSVRAGSDAASIVTPAERSKTLELRHPLARARGSDVGPAHCVSQVRTKTNVSPLFNSPTCETVRIMSTVTRTGHLVGYARVSTGHQTLNGQHDAFKTAGVDRIFDDIMSGTHAGSSRSRCCSRLRPRRRHPPRASPRSTGPLPCRHDQHPRRTPQAWHLRPRPPGRHRYLDVRRPHGRWRARRRSQNSSES